MAAIATHILASYDLSESDARAKVEQAIEALGETKGVVATTERSGVLKKLAKIFIDPYTQFRNKIHGNKYSAHAGKYRIIYTIENNQAQIVTIDTRTDVYKQHGGRCGKKRRKR